MASLLPPALLLLVIAASVATTESHIILPGIKMPADFQAMNGCSNEPNCRGGGDDSASSDSIFKVAMKHRDTHRSLQQQQQRSKAEMVKHARWRDSARATRISKKIDQATAAPVKASSPEAPPQMRSPTLAPLPESVGGSVESGFLLGSGEYFMDVYIGTPPKLFSLIIDTGSDLIWTQCEPCSDCYQQDGPIYAPNASSTYRPLRCNAPQCAHVAPQSCDAGSTHGCTYSYWYGDSSNTTGDLATETVALGAAAAPHGRGRAAPYSFDGIVFGCGHSNEGLFRSAAGLLGLGKGPLSLPSQLGHRFGGKFSYCLVNRYSNASVTSALTFGGDAGIVQHPDVQYTRFMGNHAVSETFYYVGIDRILVGGEAVEIAAEAWRISGDGGGGTIIDSGTTLTYLNSAAYDAVWRSFAAKVAYPRATSDELDLCYNVTGHSTVEFPSITFVFHDGAVLELPAENYMVDMGDGDGGGEAPSFCLGILRAPQGSPSILGNLLQQNIHFLYDVVGKRLGFAPMPCAAHSQG